MLIKIRTTLAYIIDVASLFGLAGLISFLLNYFSIIPPGWLIVLYMPLVVVLAFCAELYGSRLKIEALRPIPQSLQENHQILLALGFELTDFGHITPIIVPYKQWFYFNENETVYAYMNERGKLWFSSYFEKNFDLTTRFREGEGFMETKRSVAHTVKSSVEATFDYHLQHRQKYIGQYGELLVFATPQAQLDWERSHIRLSVSLFSLRDLLKFFGRLILGYVIAGFAWGLVLITVSIFFSDYPIVVVIITGLDYVIWFAPLVWALWPLFRPKTVEDRKGKKQAHL